MLNKNRVVYKKNRLPASTGAVFYWGKIKKMSIK